MTPSDYRERAEECLALGQKMKEADGRAKMLELAHAWMALADDGVTAIPPEPVYVRPDATTLAPTSPSRKSGGGQGQSA